MVTLVPPAAGPLLGLIPVTVGAEALYVNLSAALVGAVPAVVMTVTSTAPFPAGLTTVNCVSFVTAKLVPTLAPKFTAVAPVNPVPLIVTFVPPAAGPLLGLIPVTVDLLSI
jgi:hypothetical protein